MPRREKRRIIDFKPKYLDDYDFRYGAAKKIRRIYLDLRKQCDINSVAKDLMARRAAYLAVKIETLEVESLTSKGKVSESGLNQAINTLTGILKALGLENLSLVKPDRLKEYLSHKQQLNAEREQRKRQRHAKARNRTLAIAGGQ
jgi:hypothetical protein